MSEQYACKLASPKSGQEPCLGRIGHSELHAEPLSQLFTLMRTLSIRVQTLVIETAVVQTYLNCVHL